MGLEVLRSGQNSFLGGLFRNFSTIVLLGNGEHSFPPINKAFENQYILIEHTDKMKLENQLGGNIIETAGHTSCSISLLLNSGVLFCGDVAMNNFPSIRRRIIFIENIEDFYQS